MNNRRSLYNRNMLNESQTKIQWSILSDNDKFKIINEAYNSRNVQTIINKCMIKDVFYYTPSGTYEVIEYEIQ